MPDSSKRDHLRILKTDYVGDSMRMLRDLHNESLLSFLMSAAHECMRVGKFDDIRRARVTRLASRIVKEIDKAA